MPPTNPAPKTGELRRSVYSTHTLCDMIPSQPLQLLTPLTPPVNTNHTSKTSITPQHPKSSDVKELIPEFFTCPEMFENVNGLTMGTTQSGVKVTTTPQAAALHPPNTLSPAELPLICPLALASCHASSNILALTKPPTPSPPSNTIITPCPHTNTG